MGSLKDKLAAAQAQKANAQQTQSQPRKNVERKQTIQESFLDTDIMSLDNMVFGKPTDTNDSALYENYPNGQRRKIYDPEEEMRSIREGQSFTNTQTKIPKAILAEMLSNPLDVQPIEDTSTEQLINEDIAGRTMDILNKLESRDKQSKINQEQPIMENINYTPQSSGIDMNQLASLIESVVDKKFKQYGSAIINESKKAGNAASPKLSFMRLGESFTFMDSENNVYECKLMYKGKGNVKKK